MQILKKQVRDSKSHRMFGDIFGKLAQFADKPDALAQFYKCLQSCQMQMCTRSPMAKPHQWTPNPSDMKLRDEVISGSDPDDDAASTASTSLSQGDKVVAGMQMEDFQQQLTALSASDMGEDRVLFLLQSMMIDLGAAHLHQSDLCSVLAQVWGLSAKLLYAADQFDLSIVAEICGLMFQYSLFLVSPPTPRSFSNSDSDSAATGSVGRRLVRSLSLKKM